MNKVTYNIKNQLKPFVNCIMEGESSVLDTHTTIPFYADGYPGIMFQQAQNGFYLLPKNKKLSELFLYGQTIQPIALDVQGPYKYLVVQLYPFASKYLLNIDPKILNDDCYDLLQNKQVDILSYHQKLLHANSFKTQTHLLSDLIEDLIEAHAIPQNDVIQKAISIIITHKGQIKIQEVLKQIYLTERTFERNFSAQVGLSPKQFAFFTPALLLIASIIFNYSASPIVVFRLIFIAAIFYILGTFLVTALGNVPLNNLLDQQNLEALNAEELHALRTQIEVPWNQFNLIRTLSSFTSFALLLFAAFLWYK